MIGMIRTIIINFLILSFVCETQSCENCSELPIEQLRQLRYEYFKTQILQKLHLTKPPQPNLPKPPVKSLLVIAEIAKNERIIELKDKLKTARVIIYPKNANLTCLEKEFISCSRFEYVVPENVCFEHFLSMEVLINEPRAQLIRIHQIITDPSQNLTFSLELDNTEKISRDWRKYSIYKHASNVIILEITHETDRIMEDMESFLVIRCEAAQISSRKRRSTTCIDSSTSCCKENFFLNFSEIGWDNWILHPDGYQANFCRGRCFNDLSNTRFYHSAVLLSYIRDNKDIAEDIGLNMCCTPSVMAPITIIYRNEEGLIFHKSIENMKVESCDCA